MTMRRSLIVGGLALTFLVGCSGPRKTKDLFDPSQVQEASFYKYWQAQLPLVEGDRVEQCFVVDDNLYVTTQDGMIYALESEKGLLRWCRPFTKPDYTIYPPRHLESPDGRGPLAIVTSNMLYIVDRYSGEDILVADAPFSPGGGAVGDATRLYYGSVDGHMYSLLWRHGHGCEPLTRWVLATGSPVISTPVLLKSGLMIFTVEGGRVVATTAVDKGGVWVFTTEGKILADPCVTTDSVYVASLDHSVYRIDLYSGRQVWRLRTSHPLRATPVVAGPNCYQFSKEFGLIAIDVATGKIRWQLEDAMQFLSSAGDRVTLLTRDGDYRIVDFMTGETVRTIFGPNQSVAATNIFGDAVYAAAPDGAVACIRPAENPYLRHQEVEASKAYLNRPPTKGDAFEDSLEGDASMNRGNDPFRSRMDR